MNFQVGDLITHNYGYKAIVLELDENVARICVFYHPDWAKGRLENWLFGAPMACQVFNREISEVQSGI